MSNFCKQSFDKKKIKSGLHSTFNLFYSEIKRRRFSIARNHSRSKWCHQSWQNPFFCISWWVRLQFHWLNHILVKNILLSGKGKGCALKGVYILTVFTFHGSCINDVTQCFSDHLLPLHVLCTKTCLMLSEPL